MGFFDRYPYTNWHNVNLDWVLERVKEWGQMVEANDQAFKDLEEANASFKEYVTNYLQNLDVQAQIDDKLDRMFESGVLGEYLQPYVSPTVTTWLNENITQPSGVVIDSSLTVSGACADSQATGLSINDVRNLAISVFNDGIKNMILECFNHVAWSDALGETYYNNLYASFFSNIKNMMIVNTSAIGRDTYSSIQKSLCYGTAYTMARCRLLLPVKRENYTTINVVDNDKYSVAVYNLIDGNIHSYTIPNVGVRSGYELTNYQDSITWVKTAQLTSEYVWFSFKKEDGLNFTEEEITNAYGTIYTVL